MQSGLPAPLLALRFISFTIFAQRKSLQISTSLVVRMSKVLHRFLLPRGFQSATCNETAVAFFRGKRYDLGMILDVSIGR